MNINFVYSEDADSRLSPRVILSDEDNNTISIEKVCEIYLHTKIQLTYNIIVNCSDSQ